MDKIEKDQHSENIVKVDKVNRSVTVTKPNTNPVSEPPKVYYFDNVFADDSTQVRSKLINFIFFCLIY